MELFLNWRPDSDEHPTAGAPPFSPLGPLPAAAGSRGRGCANQGVASRRPAPRLLALLARTSLPPSGAGPPGPGRTSGPSRPSAIAVSSRLAAGACRTCAATASGVCRLAESLAPGVSSGAFESPPKASAVLLGLRMLMFWPEWPRATSLATLFEAAYCFVSGKLFHARRRAGPQPARLCSAQRARPPASPAEAGASARLAPAASFRLTSLSSTDLESCGLLATESGLPEEEEYGTPRSRHRPSDSHRLRKRRRLKHDLPGPPFVGPHRGAHRPQTQAIVSLPIHRRGQDMSLRVAIVGDKPATTRVGITKVLWTFPGG